MSEKTLDEEAVLTKILAEAEEEKFNFLKNTIQKHIEDKFKSQVSTFRDKDGKFTFENTRGEFVDEIGHYLINLLVTALTREDMII